MDKNLKILFSRFWNSIGWTDGVVSDEDFIKAKEAGYMFDYPEIISHAETLKQLHTVLEQIEPVDVANAFLYSLSTRKLEYRSALRSYWYAISIPEHKSTYTTSCDFCYWYKWGDSKKDYKENRGYNVLNFERYKWGGVGHDSLHYALFDLTQFLLLPKITPSSEDVEILEKILNCIKDLEPPNKAGKYANYITKQKIIKSNIDEIKTMLDILGIIGILSTEEDPCYVDKFNNVVGRNPLEHNNDFSYPLNRWHAKDGVNSRRFDIVFAEALEDCQSRNSK